MNTLVSNTISVPTLIDWLYLPDHVTTKRSPVLGPQRGLTTSVSIGDEKQGALIVFPRMVDRWNVASLIVSKWEGYKVFIVTDHPNEFMHTIAYPSINTEWSTMRAQANPTGKSNFVQSTGLHPVSSRGNIGTLKGLSNFDTNHQTGTHKRSWTDLELIPFPLVKYSDIADINRILHNTEIDIVLFDDARMLATISSGIDFTSIQPKIIVLTSWGDTYKQLDVVTSKLPDLRLLTLDLISDTVDIKWNVIKVPMSSRQLKFYDQIRKKELESSSTSKIEDSTKTLYESLYLPVGGQAASRQRAPLTTGLTYINHILGKIPYPMTRMVTLYAYPDVIMADTLKHKAICETDQSSIPDRLDSPNTWVNNDYINTLETQGPKLHSVIDGVVSNWPNKQIISTRFNNRYGVDLIVSFLQLMTQNRKSPYELNEIYHVSCTDDYETSINTLHKFNDAESGVLVSNIVPLIPLKGVSIVHLVDSYSFLTLKMIIDRCHKRYLSKGSMDFTIYSHIATHPTDISSDVALYDILSKDVQEANRIYAGLISSSGHIVFKSGTGLLVV